MRYNYFFFGGMLLLLICSCHRHQQVISDLRLTTISRSEADIDPKKHTVTIITFLSPDCPLSENYTKTLNDLQEVFHYDDIVFADVFPGKLYPNEKIQAFVDQYKVAQQAVLDPDLVLTKLLSATVTPETFVFDHNGNLQYSGAIDNWAVDLGQKRQVITEHYLHDAILSVQNAIEPDVRHTIAVGCFIETAQ